MANGLITQAKNPIEKNRIVYKPVLYSWLSTLVGLSLYSVSIIFTLFGLIIFAFPNLRELFLNWTIASIISATIIALTAKFIINNYGAKYLSITDEFYTFKSPFGRSTTIMREDIVHIEVRTPNPIIEKIKLSSPSIVIVTHSKISTFRSRHWGRSKEVVRYFEKQSKEYKDTMRNFPLQAII